MLIRMPLGVARETYLAARKLGKTQTNALKQAAEVEACADTFACAKCFSPLDDAREPPRIRRQGTNVEVWCASCATAIPSWKK